MNVNVRDVLDRLEKVRPNGSGWTALCPLHADRNPSLSIGEGDDGTVLAFCHGPCGQCWPQLRDHLGLSDERPASSSVVREHVYLDEAGTKTFVHRKVRKPDGSTPFYWLHYDAAGQEQPGLDGRKPGLYRAWDVNGNVDVLVLTEGEKDCETLRRLGLSAVGFARGAGKDLLPDDVEVLRRAKAVVVVQDNDEAGRAHAQRLAAQLHDAGVRVRIVAPPEGHKDITDAAEAGVPTPDLFVDVPHSPVETVERLEMPGQRPDGFECFDSFISAAALDRKEFAPLNYLYEKAGVQDQGLLLLASAPKAGKSFFAIALALAVAQGGSPFGLDEAVTVTGDVLYISLDDATERRFQKRLRDIGQGQPLPDNLTLAFTWGQHRGQAAANALDVYLRSHPQTRLVVIDTLEHVRSDRRAGQSTYAADVEALAHLRAVSAHHKVLLLVLHHTRKPDGVPEFDALTAVSGSHGITGGADAILVLEAKRPSPMRLLHIIGRDDEDRRLVLRIGAAGLTITADDPDDPSVLLSPDDQVLYAAVKGFGEDGTTAAGLRDLNLTNVGDRLARLAKKGYVTKVGRGTYAVA